MTQDTNATIDKDRLAQAVAEGMYPRDHAAQGLGIELLQTRSDRASVRMVVREDMLNFHGTCHGGFLYALAGSVFAYICNADNRATVAQAGSITYTRAAQLGDVLTATAHVVNAAGRTGVYDVEVRNQKDEVVALFRGQSCKIKGESVPGLNAQFGLDDASAG